MYSFHYILVSFKFKSSIYILRHGELDSQPVGFLGRDHDGGGESQAIRHGLFWLCQKTFSKDEKQGSSLNNQASYILLNIGLNKRDLIIIKVRSGH